MPPSVDETIAARIEEVQQGRSTELDLRGFGLTELPGEIGALSALRFLSVGGNPLRHLPDFLARLTRLEQLDASETCAISSSWCSPETGSPP